ncbi:hypothetical protein EA472_06200 [Natrarchaeobius oligotrophus]|uniref:Uncharacterized protein n=1 Tax=Natrarchaeobius chitinivorans TaxID=1679083 RepID=A0A3N6MD84_NATCH|nr:hypothetical protein EA472_06200 [Natrarchaeobius chitinivorans]
MGVGLRIEMPRERLLSVATRALRRFQWRWFVDDSAHRAVQAVESSGPSNPSNRPRRRRFPSPG